MSRLVIGLIALAGMAALPAAAETVSIASPNGRIGIAVSTEGGALSYSVSYDGKAVIAPSALELKLDKAYIGGGAHLENHAESTHDGVYAIVAGKATSAPDRYSQSDLTFTQGNLKFDIVIRAYDSGAAVRYVLPAQPGLGEIKVMSEGTQFFFPADYDCWGADIGRFDSSFEAEYDPVKASKIRNFQNYMAPLVCRTGSATFAIAESDVNHYPGVYLSGRGDGGLGVAVTLPPRFDADRGLRQRTYAAVEDMTQGFSTPWRVIMLGDRPGDLTASNLIGLLATPSQIADTSWIKPAKTAWDWWNDWDVAVAHPGINTDSYKAYVDFAAAMKLDDILIDEGWSKGSSVDPNPDADITTAIAALDMPALLAYAKSKGVGVWVWVQWQQLDNQMDQAFAAYEKWGLKGIKVDFMNRNDQQMVDWYHKVLSKAAEHHLMVDLHGAYPPNGLNRTYPNFITQEGVLGAENNKWSRRITATHNVTLPFTRMILGPMDYTPGGFRNQRPETFVSQYHAPTVMTTRGQAVAMYVVYDSPLQMVSDSPSAYKNADGSWADGAEFISRVPASWDETRVLAGEIGQYIVTARRKGDTWYIGAMTNEQARDLDVPLGFLGDGPYYFNALSDNDKDPSRLVGLNASTDRHQTLHLHLAASGGAVAIIAPGTFTGKSR